MATPKRRSSRAAPIGKMNIMVRSIRRDTWQKLKVQAAIRGIPLSQYVVQILTGEARKFKDKADEAGN